MTSDFKFGVGQILLALAILGLIFLPILGLSALPRPWSFILGFFNGMFLGLGAVLCIDGLIRRRKAAK
jgi:hypothetical protein